MRFAVKALACLAVGVLSLALADPPAASPPAAASSPPAASPAPTPAAPAAPVRRTLWTTNSYEEHFLAEGYKMELHNGEKMFCRMEELPGSRLQARKVCSTLDQLKASETGNREWIERSQRISVMPKGH
jgi:hypothetical protein